MGGENWETRRGRSRAGLLRSPRDLHLGQGLKIPIRHRVITFVPGNLRENLKGGLIECWCLPEKGISGRHQHSIRPPFRIPRDRKHTSNCAHSNEHSRAPCTVDNAFWGSAPLERPAGSAHLSARIGTLWGSQDPLLALVRARRGCVPRTAEGHASERRPLHFKLRERVGRSGRTCAEGSAEGTRHFTSARAMRARRAAAQRSRRCLVLVLTAAGMRGNT